MMRRTLCWGACGLLTSWVLAAEPPTAADSATGAGLRWVAQGGERLSDGLLAREQELANAAVSNPYALRWQSLREQTVQRRAQQDLLAGLQKLATPAGASRDSGNDRAHWRRWSNWLQTTPVTGRVRLPLQDPALLQLNPRFDPVLQAGDVVWWPASPATALTSTPTTALPTAPSSALPSTLHEAAAERERERVRVRVRVLWADGSACSLPHRSAAQASDYLQACAAQGAAGAGSAPGAQTVARLSQVWIVQPDGEVLHTGITAWSRLPRTLPAPGAWIWVPTSAAANPSSSGPSPGTGQNTGTASISGSSSGVAWPEPLARSMAHWLATQEPGLKPPGTERVLTSTPLASPAVPSLSTALSTNDWGGIGLLQTPSARMQSAGHVGFSVSRSTPYTHFNLSVQPFDGVEGVMRYTRVQGRLYGTEIAGDRAYLDKSLEIKLRLWDESYLQPAVALGLRDPLGTGLFGGEYLVASKHLGAGPWGQWDASVGLGWGYSGAAQRWANPLARLSSRVRSWFTGRTALFGGVQWQTPNLPVVLKAEWDGNNYQHEPSTEYRFARRSPINLGLVWHTGAAAWTLSWQRGQALALNFSVHTDLQTLRYTRASPRSGANPGAAPSAAASAWWLNWADAFSADAAGSQAAAPETPALGSTGAPQNAPQNAPESAPSSAPSPDTPAPALQALLSALSAATGWSALDLRQNGDTWVLQVERAGGTLLRERLQAVAELLHPAAPAQILIFEVQATVLGVEVSRHRIHRAAWAQAQNQWLPPSAQQEAFTAVPTPSAAGARGTRADASSNPLTRSAALVPQRWLWQLSPGWQQSVGGPDGLLYALSARASSHLPLWRGAWLNGAAALRVADNYGHYQYTAPSGLPRVRTFAREYQTSAAFTLPNVQVNQLFALGSQTHALLYGGWLEPMFAGVGGELLFRPFGERWAVGLDWNLLRQRDFRQNLQLRDYRVHSGHLSAQWHTGWAGVEVSAQAGRYLAGDVGGTLNLSRSFANGTRMGLWATKTRVSAQQFGEGSFDKGVYVSVPFELLLGRPAGGAASVVWQPLIRDGGARLNKTQSLWGLTTLREPSALEHQNRAPPAPWQGSASP
jgi:hypothetical protein